MIHHATPDFWDSYRQLPKEVKRRAGRAYTLLRENPRHPSLHFKKIGDLWSARVTLDYRALAVESLGKYVWFWIGTHEDYELILG